MVVEGYTPVAPDAPTYPTLLMYTQLSALEVDQLSVEPPPWLIALGERETEQEAGDGSVHVMYTTPEEPGEP